MFFVSSHRGRTLTWWWVLLKWLLRQGRSTPPTAPWPPGSRSYRTSPRESRPPQWRLAAASSETPERGERQKTIQASFSFLRQQENEIQSQEASVWDVGSFNSIIYKISDWIVETTPKLSQLHVLTSAKAMRARAVRDRLTLMASVNILVLSM